MFVTLLGAFLYSIVVTMGVGIGLVILLIILATIGKLLKIKVR